MQAIGKMLAERTSRCAELEAINADLLARIKALEVELREVAVDYHMVTHGRLRMFDICQSPTCSKARTAIEKGGTP